MGKSAKARYRRRRRARPSHVTYDMGDGCLIIAPFGSHDSMAALLQIKADAMRDRSDDPWFARLADTIDDGNGGA